jgi:3'-5' exonuclease
MALIFDIETVGEEWDSFDQATRDQLTRWLSREAQDEAEYASGLEDLKSGLGFSPLTGSIVAIGVYDSEKQKGAVYFSAPGAGLSDAEEGSITYRPMEEKDMLEQFWKVAQVCTEFVSFNGRCFDAPFLAIRSAVHGIRPTKNLLEGRYLYQQRDAKHIDLLDQFSFYGAMRRKGSLHLFCRAFGIESPKASGTTGDDVAALYKNKQYLDIARYNTGDLFATAALYKRWKDTLS